jgi:hypothetical protein
MNEDGKGWDVYLLTLNDREVRRLSQNRWNSVRSIAWQSDGSKLILGADAQTPDGSEFQLCEVSVADGKVSRLVTDLLAYTSNLSMQKSSRSIKMSDHQQLFKL